jgi:hypothetical protein
MDIERERAALQHLVESQQRRIDHLKDRIDRSTGELLLHKVVGALVENSHLPEAMHSLATVPDVDSKTPSDLRAYLAERGVIVPTEFDLTVQGTGENCTVVGTYRDEMFPARVSWNPQAGFSVRMWNRAQPRH